MPDDTQAKRENLQPDFTWIKDNAFRSVYSNQTQFGSTAFDFTMTFGEITAVDPVKGTGEVEQRVRVVMSPLHFKLFVMVAAQNIKGYEEQFGTIQVPTGAVAPPVAQPKE